MFFSKPKTIIYITREKIKAGRAILGKEPRLENVVSFDWDPKDLDKVLVEVKATLGKKVRVLFDDDLSYILKISVPKSEKDERAFIARKIAEKIPETFEDEEWDFKEVAQTKDEKQVLVFAPVKGFLENLVSAAADVDLEIEAVEPASVAKKRHPDPMVGLAMKMDIKGKDEKVLNLILSEEILDREADGDKMAKASQGNESGKTPLRWPLAGLLRGGWIEKLISNKKLILIGIGGFAVFASVTVGFLVYKRLGDEKEIVSNISRSTTIEEEPSPLNLPETPNISETPQEKESSLSAELRQEDLKIQVLNGSGVAGAATKVKSLLEESKFKNIEIGNADSYDYTETEISAKEIVPDKILETIEKALGEYETLVVDPLTEDNPFDVIVVVGSEYEQ